MVEFGDMAYTRRLSSCSDTCMLIVVKGESGGVERVYERMTKVSIKEERVRI